MAHQTSSLWQGLNAAAQNHLQQRNYHSPEPTLRLATHGMEAGHVLAMESLFRTAGAWIPGIQLFHRTIHPQCHRGVFGEFVRENQGTLGQIGLWPKQWATARMYAGTAKGFHIHPPHIPPDKDAISWFELLYLNEIDGIPKRPYDLEQWDVMFFVQGRAEMFLVDERVGLPRRTMRLFIDGDNHRGPNTVGIVIPPGVAHAIRTEGNEDLIMVYGTSTVFDPNNEGRIASSIESAPLPSEWETYLGTHQEQT